MVDSSNLILSSPLFSSPTDLRGLYLAPTLSEAHSLFSSHRGPPHFFAYAVLATGNAFPILKFFHVKANRAYWFLQVCSNASLPPSLLWSFCLLLGNPFFICINTTASSPSPLPGTLIEYQSWRRTKDSGIWGRDLCSSGSFPDPETQRGHRSSLISSFPHVKNEELGFYVATWWICSGCLRCCVEKDLKLCLTMLI